MRVKAAFGWVGGKSRLAGEIIARFPEHKLYAEVFAGSLAVLYAKERSKIEVVNDLDDSLINLHRVIQTRPVSLSAAVSKLWYSSAVTARGEPTASRRLFEQIRSGGLAASNDGRAQGVATPACGEAGALLPRANAIERVALTYYEIVASFSSCRGQFRMIKSNSKPCSLVRDFTLCAERLKRVTIESMSYERLIAEYDGADTLFYLDPPYVACENYYRGLLGGGFGRQDHERLRDCLRGIKGRFVLSYNDVPLVRELYKGYEIHEALCVYSVHKGVRTRAVELIICG